ncbi:taste receptor type 2 member 140-like [Psammomys obesus]|uniref:taste receptor type 2 member 140-like n=1 Tax=Psammomys obesus TaxID=48139 RepID=UPI00245364C8|nr:taste receptor type 2 member 140-like [Psammomys obesus]
MDAFACHGLLNHETSPTENQCVQKSVLVIILIMQFMTGCFGNAFIALVNITDWVKRRGISAADQSPIRCLKSTRHCAKGCRDISTATHIKALQPITSFLPLYCIFFL